MAITTACREPSTEKRKVAGSIPALATIITYGEPASRLLADGRFQRLAQPMGQSVKAVVQPVDWAQATDDFAAELLEWLRDRLAYYECPRSISFQQELPRSDTGKLYKRELVARYSTP